MLTIEQRETRFKGIRTSTEHEKSLRNALNRSERHSNSYLSSRFGINLLLSLFQVKNSIRTPAKGTINPHREDGKTVPANIC